MQVYVSKNNSQFGPFDLIQLRELVNKGNFELTDYACYDNQNWIFISQLPGFSGNQMIHCRVCGNLIALVAPSCPHCGALSEATEIEINLASKIETDFWSEWNKYWVAEEWVWVVVVLIGIIISIAGYIKYNL